MKRIILAACMAVCSSPGLGQTATQAEKLATAEYMFARLCSFQNGDETAEKLNSIAANSENPFVQAFFVETIDAMIFETLTKATPLERAQTCVELALEREALK